MRHAFNIREGIDVAAVKMPERARGNPPLKTGPNAYSQNVLIWEDAKRDYRVAMGYDPKSAIPLAKTLRELGLQNIEKDIYG